MKVVFDVCQECGSEFRKITNKKFCSATCYLKFRLEYCRAWRDRSAKYVMVAGAKCRAKRKGLEFSITEEDIDIPMICPVLGIPLKKNKTSGFHNNSPSLDRIDNNRGYVPGNVRVISNRANMLKCDATIEELEKVLEDMRAH